MRILLPSNMNQDSTWTFIMFADPFYEGALYNIGPPLNQKYGEEGAKEVFARWNSCFAKQLFHRAKTSLAPSSPYF